MFYAEAYKKIPIELTQKELSQMSREEVFDRLTTRIEVYNDEFEHIGVDRLRVKNK